MTSILANRDIAFELLVIDQSDTTASRGVVNEVGVDPRLRWITTDSRGLSVGRNVGVELARAPIVAFTDDDCRVSPTWVGRIFELFASDPQLCLLFGAVTVRPEDRAKGFAASFMPKGVRELRGRIPAMHDPWGIGANMAIRRRAFEVIGTFDPRLGAGTPLFAGEEFDMTIRALAAGLKVVETPHNGVLHIGVRSGKDASWLMRGYGVGFGAVFIKHVWLGTPGSLLALTEFFLLHVWRSLVKALRGHPSPGFGLLAGILWGVSRFSMRSLDEVPRSPGDCVNREVRSRTDEST